MVTHSKTYLNTLKDTLATLNKKWEAGGLKEAELQKLEAHIDTAATEWVEASKTQPDTPMISVAMSVYNTEAFIAEALESILDQTFKNFEIVLIDDGSSDKSIEIVRTYKDDRIRIIHQTNHGLVYSFNKAVRLSRGRFIARMDADDICLPTRFEKELIWLLTHPKHGLVGTFFRYIEQETAEPLDVIQTSPLTHADIVRMMYMVNPYGHGSVMYRKEAIDAAGGYRSEYEPSEDYDLWRRIALDWRVGQIPEVLYLWRFQTSGLGNISQRKRKQSNDSAAKTVNNMWAGPLVGKFIKDIVHDGRELQMIEGGLGPALYNQYVDQQFRLTEAFAAHGKMRTAFKTAIGITWLEPGRSLQRIWKNPGLFFNKTAKETA